MTKAVLALEDGAFFEGEALGAPGEAFGEVVFNTSITGYQEVLTDPSYRGQIVTMTYPLIGNYGMVPEDDESGRPWLSGFVVREASAIRSNWRSTVGLPDWLSQLGVVGIHHIDTRSLTRHLRIEGAKQGVISTVDFDRASLARKLESSPRIVGRDLVREVSCQSAYHWTEPLPGGTAPEPRRHVVVLDCGVKRNILRHLVSAGCAVTVVPAATTAAQIQALNPDGLLLSNGPGDPEPVTYVVETARSLLGRLPIFGICLGQQMLGLAMGGKTYKLKFGHRGANQPVQELATGKVDITCQNHGFAVDAESLAGKAEVTHLNLNDGTVEGLRALDFPAFSVQYHPEASPGPHDARKLFREFLRSMQ